MLQVLQSTLVKARTLTGLTHAKASRSMTSSSDASQDWDWALTTTGNGWQQGLLYEYHLRTEPFSAQRPPRHRPTRMLPLAVQDREYLFTSQTL